ncbi:MAG: hypothetical protein K8S13_21545 [Desulfobacula sp.]|uniref:FISUMP domain-containing protein n=1 Tax=Desulfobacula sp. TaxID=2593537 RepID=UPI0025BDF8FB|nr:FISUMP domain-containing protein [Desulfobacula sp.]MCD4722418.1 hypothetical protein [Desulfobacula sp.]
MKKKPYNCIGTIFIFVVLVLQVFGMGENVNAGSTLCQVSSDSNNDGDVDGTDLQLLAAALENGTQDNGSLVDFVELFGTDDVDSALAELQPQLAMVVATGTDKLEMAWTPGEDGQTPSDQIIYDIYLGLDESFITDASTLVDTVTGTNQLEITGLESDTRYYGKVIATYANHTSCASNCLQTKTYPFPIQENQNTVISKAWDLGLGKHTTSDGITYIYSEGTLPPVGSILFSEDVAGGMTIRRVESATSSGAEITVVTSDASLVDVLDRGAGFTAFKLFDVAQEAEEMPSTNMITATAISSKSKDGSRYSRIDWKNNLLSAEQTTYAYDTDTFSVQPQNGSSAVKLYDSEDYSSEFEATVTAEFEPELITHAEWGGSIFTELDSAHVGAKGTLTLTAKAQYNFSAAGDVSKNFKLWDRTWATVYQAGPVPVYQEITLSMDVVASASASVAIEAMAQAQLTETVELGATYDGFTWTPYITYNEETSLTASLDIKGEASAEIRLIPKIKVTFYRVVSASLTVEPFAGSSLTFAETTNNLEFLAAHPEHVVELTSFDASLGMEANVAASLSALGWHWDVLPSTCVLGTGDCLYAFNELELFSIPQLALTANGMQLQLQVTDGTNNRFNPASVEWEVFPNDAATIQQGSCSQSGDTTTCFATLIPGEEEYMVFVSGHGILGEMGRQFENPSPSSCGAYIAPGVWKEFDCYNLAAVGKTTDDDPFIPSWRLIGGYWQWGRKGIAAQGPTGPDPAQANYDAISGWNTSYAPNGSWSDAYKTANDPCPDGYRVPTHSQWQGVMENNPQSVVGTWSTTWDDYTNYSAALFFGNSLMLPAAGCRHLSSGWLNSRGQNCLYWSSTEDSTDSNYAWYQSFNGNFAATNYTYRGYGLSVRCVAE